MNTIWKYELQVTDEQVIEMPGLAEILCVQIQNGVPCIWAKVWTDAPLKKRVFETIGTGNPIPGITMRRQYIGTYQMMGGGLVFHVFELKP